MSTNDRFVGLKATQAHVYKKELASVKKYGDKYKLTLYTAIREKGWEEPKDAWLEYFKYIMKNDVDEVRNECKLGNHIARARGRIFELAICNDWQYFVTMTLNPEKYARDNLKVFQKDLGRFIDLYRRTKCPELSYLLIPELHKDGVSWHMHGLINGLRNEFLTDFIQGKHPQFLIDNEYKNWPDYMNKFGFISLGPMRNHEAVSKYITKYITKELSAGVTEYGAHMYYSSHGLKGAQEIKRGPLKKAPENWEYENEFVKIIWLSEEEVNDYI